MKEKRLSIRLPKDLHDQFKAAAATNGKTMTEVILDCVADYVQYPRRITITVGEEDTVDIMSLEAYLNMRRRQ